MLTPCKHCPNWQACKKHGCYAWNDEARKKIQNEAKGPFSPAENVMIEGLANMALGKQE